MFVMLLGTVANWQVGVLVALGLEQLVGDAHLDVVGLAGEHQQRLVLRLPSEARDRAVVAVVVRLAGDGPARQVEIGRPRMPSALLRCRVARVAGEIAASGICSIKPSPNVGVGMRKTTLWFASCLS